MKRLYLLFLAALFISCETVPTRSEMEFLLDLIEADEQITVVLPPDLELETIALPEEWLSEELHQEGPSEELLAEAESFDPDSIGEEFYEITKTEIQGIVFRLNRIIRAKDYNEWRRYLSDSYLSTVSSPEFLEEKTDELHRRDQLIAAATGKNPNTVEKKELKNLKDYFDNVVVPSRANDRVDDIYFITETRVRAYTVNNRGTRLILYDLEIIGDSWKIIG